MQQIWHFDSNYLQYECLPNYILCLKCTSSWQQVKMSTGTIRIPASEKGMLPAIPALGKSKQNEVSVGYIKLHFKK